MKRIDLAALAELTDGMSAAEVRFVCDRAAMNAIRRIYSTTECAGSLDVGSLRIEQRDFDDALAESRTALEPSTSQQPLDFGIM